VELFSFSSSIYFFPSVVDQNEHSHAHHRNSNANVKRAKKI